MRDLLPHQPPGIDFLARRQRALLADDPGLGKTLQAITASKQVLGDYPDNICLIICPKSALPVWKCELDSCGEKSHLIHKGKDIAKLPADVRYVVIGFALFRLRYKDIKKVFVPRLLIVDEAHFIKDIDSLTNEAITDFAVKAPYAWFLTGTPVKNHYGEFFALARLIVPWKVLSEVRLDSNRNWEATFTTRVLDSVRKYDHRAQQVVELKFWRITGSQNPKMLKDLIGPYLLRRKKGDVLKDLPALSWQALPVALSSKVPYKSSDVDEIADAAERGQVPTHFMAVRAALANAKVEACAELVKEHVESTSDPIVVMCYHVEAIAKLEAMLRDAGLRVVTLQGSTSPKNRDEYVKAFQNGEVDCFIGQTLAAGTAITLTKANRIIFIDLMWSPADNIQARDRLHRIGQTRDVVAQYLVAEGHELDARVNEILSRKTKDLEELEAA